MEFNKIKLNVISKFGVKSDDLKNKVVVEKEKSFLIPVREKIDISKYELVTDETKLKEWCKLIEKKGTVAIDCETDSLNAVDAEIVGFSISLENSCACYIPLNHKTENLNQIDKNSFINIIRPILEDESILKIGQNIKFDFIVLNNLGIGMRNMDDTMLMSYVLRTGYRGHNLDELSLDYLSHNTKKFSEITTVEKKNYL